MTKQAGGLREDYVSAIAARKFPQAVKVLEKLLAEAQRPCTDQTASTLQLLCNRAQLYHRMGLSRKALKDYDEALALQPTCLQAAVGKGKVLYSLKKAQEAQKCWKDACNSAGPESDLTVLLEAHSLAKDPEAVLNPQPAASKPAPVANGLANGNAVHRAEPSASFGPSTPQKASAPSSSHKAPITGPARPPSAAWANTNPAAAVSVAVTQINAGKLPEAIALLDKVIAENKKPDLGAHVARGTARALRRELEAAIEDFSVAIELNPNFDDAYKRRGQARAALEQDKLALADLRRAVELSRTHQQKAEGHQEIGMLFQRQRDFRKATAEFQKVVEMDPTNAAAWNLLGLCRTSQGDIPAGLQAYEQAIKLNPKHREAWINMAQAKKEVGLVEEARVAFVRGTSLDSGRASQSVAGMRVLAQMWQGTGDHFKAVSVLDDALTRCKTGGATVDCLFLRAACNHALGFHLPAVQDYERALTVEGNTSDETKMQQFLAFYQKEMALYVRHNMDRNVADFCLDREIHPMFKESWCKKGPPTTELLMHYRMQPPPRPGPSPPRPSPAILGPLTAEADRIGALLQNRHSGFLPNKRQQRMGGLAAIELAQAVRHLVAERKAGRKVLTSTGGSGDDAQHAFGWRDAMDLVVKWRQLSEPNDQVVWVDLLTRKEFEAGFGSHTPIYSGQTKCVRYYMNFERGFSLFKDILIKEGHSFDASNNPVPLGGDQKRADIAAAKTAEELWQVIGVDSWAVVHIESCSRAGHSMEGTRLTLVKLRNQPDAYEFSIRTPVTPPRWQDYDQELSVMWEATMAALVDGDLPLVAQSALRYAYYWYNFMPLARGTAVVGYITLLGLFMAAGMPVTASIPKNYQVDWEALLSHSPQPFIESVSRWMYPPQARTSPFEPQLGPSASSAGAASTTPAGTAGAAGAAGSAKEGTSALAAASAAAAEPTPASAAGAAAGSGSAAMPLSAGVSEPTATGTAGTAGTAGKAASTAAALGAQLSSLPLVKDVLSSMRHRLEALNGLTAPRI